MPCAEVHIIHEDSCPQGGGPTSPLLKGELRMSDVLPKKSSMEKGNLPNTTSATWSRLASRDQSCWWSVPQIWPDDRALSLWGLILPTPQSQPNHEENTRKIPVWDLLQNASLLLITVKVVNREVGEAVIAMGHSGDKTTTCDPGWTPRTEKGHQTKAKELRIKHGL